MQLREKVLRGGIYLSLRQGIGLAVGVAGVLLVTRLIGPTQYGLYRGALEIMAFFAGVARWGLDAYLVRREEQPTRAVYNQAFSLLLLGSLGFAALGFMSEPLLGRWMGDIRYLAPLRFLLAALPFTVLSIPAVAQLERELDYRKVAALETVGQILYQGLSVALAWKGWGLWAPVAGYILWQVWTTLASCVLARYRPGWHWSTPLAREMLNYGAGYSSSFWVYNLRSLVNPLIVGRYLGPQEVGFVSLTIRLVEVLGFVRAATFRLSIATLGRVQQDAARLKRALEEGLGLQALALGMPLAAFALVAPMALPRLFGNQWAPALAIYPYIALGFFAGGVFAMLASVLYVRRRNFQVTGANAVHSILFGTVAILLVPRLGLLGYGCAEIGAMASYFVLHRFAARLFPFNYRSAIPWALAFVPVLFTPLVGWPWRLFLLLPLATVSLSPLARGKLVEVWTLFRRGTI
ncbi:MAG: oligosaccharide flippase family protein [Acidobacteria bacterium]|nr:oligosaccharide flippase family protein [Acidobacteriota bacterium]